MEKSPDAFRTISEAAHELELPQHVLRFWETRFPQIRPLKRGGGRRFYRPDDVQLLSGIKVLLYAQGFTIKGVQKILKENGARHVIAIGETGAIATVAPADLSPEDAAIISPEGEPNPSIDTYSRARLNEALKDMLEAKRLLEAAREG
ncbi:MAG: MerR family transcriptional regulator [Alphaproteobacteria bacterium]|nr:MerR family transcriptional regulator [Alphaproteobacteria bacterium]